MSIGYVPNDPMTKVEVGGVNKKDQDPGPFDLKDVKRYGNDNIQEEDPDENTHA